MTFVFVLKLNITQSLSNFWKDNLFTTLGVLMMLLYVVQTIELLCRLAVNIIFQKIHLSIFMRQKEPFLIHIDCKYIPYYFKNNWHTQYYLNKPLCTLVFFFSFPFSFLLGERSSFFSWNTPNKIWRMSQLETC